MTITRRRSAFSIASRVIQALSCIPPHFVVAETHALILNRLRRQDIGSQFLRDISRSVTHKIHVTEQMEREAERFIEQHPEHTYSLADATSFVVMRQLHIMTVFSFDADFRDAGFTLLEP